MYLLDLKENRNILIIFDSNGWSADSAVSNFPLMAQIALITQTLTTRLIGKGQPAKNETHCSTLAVKTWWRYPVYFLFFTLASSLSRCFYLTWCKLSFMSRVVRRLAVEFEPWTIGLGVQHHDFRTAQGCVEPSPVRLPSCWWTLPWLPSSMNPLAPFPALFVALSKFPNNWPSVSVSLFVKHLGPLSLLPHYKCLCINNYCILEDAQ